MNTGYNEGEETIFSEGSRKHKDELTRGHFQFKTHYYDFSFAPYDETTVFSIGCPLRNYETILFSVNLTH